MHSESAKLGIAFALVCLAGLCAPLGACAVLFMRKSHTALLAASIALAAGVMVFISLTEVLADSLEEVHHAGWSSPVTHTLIYLAFFGGVILCRALDWFADSLMRVISRFSRHRSNSSGDVHAAVISVHELSSRCSCHDAKQLRDSIDSSHKPPVTIKQQTCDLEVGYPEVGLFTVAAAPAEPANQSEDQYSSEPASGEMTAEEAHDRAIVTAVEQLADENCGHLIRTSVLVWLALSLHNVPEGLATLVGYMSSPHLGVTVAVAIAIHNIPEGIALGVPVFFATGSRWKAIGWAAASGLAEPLGALIGLALQLTGQLNPVAMGLIMAVVAGVMTGIAFQELLPRALSFDPTNKYTTWGVFSGMAVMAVSLVLLSLWDTTT